MLTNFILGWKCLPGTNALANFEKSLLTSVTSFITLATRGLKVSVGEVAETGVLSLETKGSKEEIGRGQIWS